MARLTFTYQPPDAAQSWSCHVRCGRCDHTKAAGGRRCRNRTCFGFPKCWVHSKAAYGVQVKPSTIPNSGKGLFATRAIARNAWICPYTGEITDDACMDQRYGDDVAPYADGLDDVVIDSACERGIGSMAQGLFRADGKPRPRGKHNAEGAVRHLNGVRKAWLRALRPIAQGAEIFHFYGMDYELVDNHTTRRVRGPIHAHADYDHSNRSHQPIPATPSYSPPSRCTRRLIAAAMTKASRTCTTRAGDLSRIRTLAAEDFTSHTRMDARCTPTPI